MKIGILIRRKQKETIETEQIRQKHVTSLIQNRQFMLLVQNLSSYFA